MKVIQHLILFEVATLPLFTNLINQLLPQPLDASPLPPPERRKAKKLLYEFIEAIRRPESD